MKIKIFFIASVFLLMHTADLFSEEPGTGIVVGKVILKHDGFQNQHREMVGPFVIKIAAWQTDIFGENKDNVYEVVADKDGLFIIENVNLQGFFRLVLLELPGDTPLVIPSPVRSPDSYKGQAIMFPLLFSATKNKTQHQIVDMGTTYMILNKNGDVSIRVISDQWDRMTSDKGFERKDIDYHSAVLVQLSKKPGKYNGLIVSYLNDRRVFQSALKQFNMAKKSVKSADVESHLRQAIKIYPGFNDAYIDLAGFYLKQRQSEKAVILLTEGIRHTSNNFEIYEMLVKALLSVGRWEEAQQFASKYHQMHPDLLNGFILLADVMMARSEVSGALNILSRCFNDVKRHDKYLHAARLMEKYGRKPDALEYYQAFHKLKPYDSRANTFLAIGYLINQRIEDLREVIKDFPEAYLCYLVSLKAREIKQHQLAIELAEKALSYYSDGTMNMSKDELQQYIDNTGRAAEFESYWVSYLKKIQVENDYKNWQGRPYDDFINQ